MEYLANIWHFVLWIQPRASRLNLGAIVKYKFSTLDLALEPTRGAPV